MANPPMLCPGDHDLDGIAVAALAGRAADALEHLARAVDDEQVVVVAGAAERVVPLEHAQQRAAGRDRHVVHRVRSAVGGEVGEHAAVRVPTNRLEEPLPVGARRVPRGGVVRHPGGDRGAYRLGNRPVLEERLAEEAEIVDDDVGAGGGQALDRLDEGEVALDAAGEQQLGARRQVVDDLQHRPSLGPVACLAAAGDRDRR